MDHIACLVRRGTEILLVRRESGALDALAEPVEEPSIDAARRLLESALGSTPVQFVRSGDPIENGGEIHPYLWECEDEVESEPPDTEWVQPPAILERAAAPQLWAVYRAVAPTADVVRTDTDHGAAYLSVRALEVIRDAAAEVAAGRSGVDVEAIAAELRSARPGMGVIATRIDRLMSGDRSLASIRDRAIEACEAAIDSDRRAGERAAAELADRVLTLSRSGTVEVALRRAEPTVYVAESRPACEGVAVAESLADADLDVTLCVDAAVATVLETESVGALLVGADAVTPDAVYNKVGTTPAALAAAELGVDCYAVAARDKIRPDAAVEAGDPDAVYDGDADVRALNPTFEPTPLERFDAVVTESGRLDAAAVERIASEHAALVAWTGR